MPNRPNVDAARRAGIVAIVKSFLLMVCVPIAILRLWMSLPHATMSSNWHLFTHLSTWSEIAVVAVAELWLIGTTRLVRDITHAFRDRSQFLSSSWSGKWASAIAGMFLFVSATTPIGVGTASASNTSLHRAVITLAAKSGIHTPEMSALIGHEALWPKAPYGFDAMVCAAIVSRIDVERRRLSLPSDGRTTTADRLSQLAELQQTFVKAGDPSLLAQVENANHALWSIAAVGALEQTDASLQFVQVHHDVLRLQLATPQPSPPDPFVATSDKASWELSSSVASMVNHRPATDLAGRWMPELLPIGRSEMASYLVALGPWQSLGIVGEPTAVDETLRALIVTLQALPWSQELEVELIGLPVMDGTASPTWMRQSSVAMLEEFAATSPVHRQERCSSDWRQARVVMIGREVADGIDPSLLRRLQRASGLIVGGQQGTSTLEVTQTSITLRPQNIALSTPRLSLETFEAINALCGASFAQEKPIYNAEINQISVA